MIHVVSGHICSGKSTWVREQAGPADVVIDFDLLAAALAPPGTADHDWPQPIADVARAVRWMAIDEAVRAHARGRIANVWIVHAYPTPADVARYHRIGAGFKRQTCEAHVLLARAKAERPPAMVAELTRRLGAEMAATQNATPGVGSAENLTFDGKPRVPSARISAGF